MDADTTTVSPETLRAEMVATVRKAGYARRSEVQRVLLDTPRHEFVPDADLAVAYDPWQAVITHRFEDGRSLSCASAPWLVAAMLDQLDVQPLGFEMAAGARHLIGHDAQELPAEGQPELLVLGMGQAAGQRCRGAQRAREAPERGAPADQGIDARPFRDLAEIAGELFAAVHDLPPKCRENAV